MKSSTIYKWLCVLSVYAGIYGKKYKFSLQMPANTEWTKEGNLCTYKEIPRMTLFATSFDPVADQETVQSMLLFGCRKPKHLKPLWECMDDIVCDEAEATIIYTWARNASSLALPNGAAFKVGGNSGILYFVLQVNYAPSSVGGDVDHPRIDVHFTTRPARLLAGTYLFDAGSFSIPSTATGHHVDVECTYTGRSEFVPIAFRTCTKGLGRVASVYRIRDGLWKLIGKGSPQVPQVFYPVPARSKDAVRRGDVLVARCTYSNASSNSSVHSGPFHDGEICNFYLMYYTTKSPAGRDSFINDDMECSEPPQKARKFPADSEVIPDFQQALLKNARNAELAALKPVHLQTNPPAVTHLSTALLSPNRSLALTSETVTVSSMAFNVSRANTTIDTLNEPTDTDGISPTMIPAIVIVAVLATPVFLICFTAIVQNMRVNRRLNLALIERDKAVLGRRHASCCCCCWQRNPYYGRQRNGFALLHEGDSDEQGDDTFAGKSIFLDGLS